MKKLLLFFAMSLTTFTAVKAQRTGGLCIADTLAQAHESAMLHIISTKKGLLLPTVNIEERDRITPLAPGLTVFIKDDSYTGFQFWNGDKWLGLEVINERKASMIAPLGGIIMYHGRFENFDANGKGLPGTEMEGWQLCNGKNGAPDLTSRFIVSGGRKSTDLSGLDTTYAAIGHTRDIANTFKIDSANLPSHTHSIDQSATINFSHNHTLKSENTYGEETAYNGHKHQFTTKPSGSRKKGELSRKDKRKGNDVDKLQLQASVDLTKLQVSTETAQVQFTVDGNVIKSFPDNDAMPKFDNRPKYYVLAFIIRIDDNIKEGGYNGIYRINY